MDERDALLTDLAERQHGLVTTAQVRELGLTVAAWRHRLRRGDWESLDRGVARRRGAPPSDEQHALAEVLRVGPHALVSHHSGAAFWGVPGFRIAPVQVMTLRALRQCRPNLGHVHFPRHLPDPFAATIDGVPVVRPALVLLQMAPLVHPEKLHRMLDNMWSRRLLSGPSVRAELAPVMHRGRAGTVAMRTLLDSLPDDYVPAASNLESRFARILSDAGLPTMRRQVDLGDEQRWCGRVDFVARDLALVVEVQSDRYHTALSDQRADTARLRHLATAGFEVVEVSEFEIWHRRHVVVDKIRAARRRAAQLAA